MIRIVQHTHNPDPVSVAPNRLKSTMKNKSGTPSATPTQILVETTATAASEMRVALGKLFSKKGVLTGRGFYWRVFRLRGVLTDGFFTGYHLLHTRARAHAELSMYDILIIIIGSVRCKVIQL